MEEFAQAISDSLMPPEAPVEEKSAVQRGEPVVDEQRKALVLEWLDKVEISEKHWEKDFKRMREDMQFARVGSTKEWKDGDNYVVPIIPRHINQTVAGLYAKNPRVVVELKERLEYTLWDGEAETLQTAMQGIAASMVPPAVDPMTGMIMPPPPVDPQALAIIKEVSEVQQKKRMLKKVAKSQEIVLQYYMGEQTPPFKKQLKQFVRRTKTCGVGYIWLGFQRLLERNPEIESQIADVSEQIARIENLTADLQDGLIEDGSARLEELKTMLADLQAQVEVITREGPVFDFPRSTDIIIDKKCKQLSTLIGAEWVARRFHMLPEEIQEAYNVDIREHYTAYRKVGMGDKQYWVVSADKEDKKEGAACVYEVWSKKTGQKLTIVKGYPDFLKGPAAPEVRLERFWPVFVLTFNDVEHEEELYPLSDAHMLRHPQMEYNRSREMRRQHRRANAPTYVSVKGRLSKEDKDKLSSRNPFDIVELNALGQGEDVNSLLQVLKPAPLDPALYETNSEMEDLLRTVGAQEANIGGVSGATATESSIAEDSRISSVDSNIDDLDECLSELVRATGEMCLLELDIQTVKKIAGPGAEWPQLSRAEIIEEIFADIKAGSSGRPNRAADLANLERGMPFLLQMGGIKMSPIAERYAALLDINMEDMVAEGLPSQIAMNAMASKLQQGGGLGGDVPAGAAGAAGAAGDPASQGAAGGDNAPAPPGAEQGSQPAFPAPTTVQYDQSGQRVAA